MAPTGTGLLRADGSPVTASDIALVRLKASLDGGTRHVPWAYDAASPRSQAMTDWLPMVGSPDGDINWDRDRMAARGRDLSRNDPWSRGSVMRIQDTAIGAHFFPVPQPNWRALARYLGAAYDATWAKEFTSWMVSEWRMWADDTNRRCDVSRRLTITQMMRLMLGTRLIVGENLGMICWDSARKEAMGAAGYATCVQAIDPDRLSNPFEQVDTADRRGGVIVDAVEAPLGYSIRRAHQYDYYNAEKSMQWDDHPRETGWGRRVMVHDFDQERETQHRGVSIYAAIMGRSKMLHTFDKAALGAAIARATYGFFVKSPYDSESVAAALGEGDAADVAADFTTLSASLRADFWEGKNLTMANGMRIPTMAPGEEIQSVGHSGEGRDFEAFQGAALRSYAANSGQSAEEITWDFSKLNYSSFRGAMLQAWKTLIRRRTDFASGTAQPIYSAFAEEATSKHRALMPRGFTHDQFVQLRSAFDRAMWIGPGRGWVDPVKERQGEVLGLDAGFGTLEETCAQISGHYWEDTLDQRQREVAAFHERGLKLPEVFIGGEDASELDRKPQPA
jgi:lambda family phage portal protein